MLNEFEKSIGPVQLFLRSKFTPKEILSTKRTNATYISNLLNFLSTDDINIVVEYKNFLDNLSDAKENYFEKKSPKKEIFFFERTDKFMGHKPGWVFMTGEHGLGYYLDVPNLKI